LNRWTDQTLRVKLKKTLVAKTWWKCCKPNWKVYCIHVTLHYSLSRPSKLKLNNLTPKKCRVEFIVYIQAVFCKKRLITNSEWPLTSLGCKLQKTFQLFSFFCEFNFWAKRKCLFETKFLFKETKRGKETEKKSFIFHCHLELNFTNYFQS